MRTFFFWLLLVVGGPVAAQTEPSFGALVSELDRQVETLFKPSGKPVKGWSEGGVDLNDLLQPSSSDPQLLFEADEQAPSVLANGVPLTALLPAGWYPTKSMAIGPASKLGEGQVAIVALSPTMVIVITGAGRKIGTADCGGGDLGAELTYYRHPRAQDQPDEMETALQFFMERYFRKLVTADVCAVTRPLSRGRFKTSYYVSDGRELKVLNKDAAPSTLRPIRDLPALLKLQP
jgi:hypothetical protein